MFLGPVSDFADAPAICWTLLDVDGALCDGSHIVADQPEARPSISRKRGRRKPKQRMRGKRMGRGL
jgi:hypothetical protein